MKRNLLIQFKFSLIVFAFVLFAGTAYAALPKILVIPSENTKSYIKDVKNKLDSTGMFSSVDVFNAFVGTPDIATLEMFDAILVFTDELPADSILLGDNLAAYIENGGGVVDAVYDNASTPIRGKYDSIAYRCLVPLYKSFGTVLTLDSIILPDHPIMKDIVSFNGGTGSYVSNSDSLAPGAYPVALYDNKSIFIAAKENVGSAKARRVSLNFYPPSSDVGADYWVAGTDGAKIMANALTWVANLHNKLPKVLLAGADNDNYIIDVRNKILSTGMFSEVDTINIKNYVPSLNKMRKYKAILVWNEYQIKDTTLFGDNLATYVDSGGAVVDAHFVFSYYIEIAGRFKSSDYQCLIAGAPIGGFTCSLGTIEKPGHALMSGINSFNGGSSSPHTNSDSLASGAYVVARYDNNDILIAAKENVGPSKTRRVSLNFFPPSSDVNSSFWDKTTDGAKIMANALIWAMSAANNCLNFDGVDDYVKTDISPVNGTPFTYMASVFPATNIGDNMILGTCTSNVSWDGFWLEVNGAKLRFYTGDDDVLSDDDIPVNQWTNVAVTYDTTTARIYINGLFEGEYIRSMSGINGGKLYIGSIGPGILNQYNFNGSLDNLSIWNRTLSAAEILNFQNKKLNGSEPGLTAFYDFNQGTAGGNNPNDTILLDLKDTLNNGILHNFALTGGTSNWIGSVAYISDNVPALQAKDITFSGVTTNHMTVNWVRGNGENCVVFMKQSPIDSASPIFGTTYTSDLVFGNGTQIDTSGWYCVYNGTGSSVLVTNLVHGKTYAVHVCEYNGTPGNEEYNTSTAENNPAVRSIPNPVNLLTEKDNFIIYPNPSSGFLTVENPGNKTLHYIVYDISGKARLSGSVANGRIDISELQSGLYILEINKTQKFKLIKQ